jgi:tRNA(Ile)-lysidine synthase
VPDAGQRDAPLSPVEAIDHLLDCLPRPSRLLVAVSGGSDSIGLLVALKQAVDHSSPKAIDLVAVTIDHDLRPEAAAEARTVGSFCDRLQIEHVVRRWEGTKPATGVAAAARTARYDLLCQVAAERQACVIVTAHTFDDQVETIAMRGARRGGAGGAGSTGMASSTILDRRYPLLRPFLATRREAIRDLLRSHDISWVEDPSNVDQRSERARLRQDLPTIPAGQEADVLRQWREAAEGRRQLSSAAADLADDYLSLHQGVAARLELDVLNGDQGALRLLIGALTAIIGGRVHVPSRAVQARIGQFLDTATPGRTTAGRVLFERRREALYMVREDRYLPVLQVEAGETILWDGRFRISNRRDHAIDVAAPSITFGAGGEGGPDAAHQQPVAGLLPTGIAQLARRSRPMLSISHDRAGCDQPAPLLIDGSATNVTIERVLLPFDRFLPEFDWQLANSLAAVAELPSFPPSPFDVFSRKTGSAPAVALARGRRNPMLSDK